MRLMRRKLTQMANKKEGKILEKLLFPEGTLRFMPPLNDSAAMEIMDLLIVNPIRARFKREGGGSNFEEMIKSLPVAVIEEQIIKILGIEHREVIRYKCIESFRLEGGSFRPLGEVPMGLSPSKARNIIEGSTILARADKRNKYNSIEIQHLTKGGLFQQENEDWKIFRLTPQQFADILRFMKREERVRDGTGFNVTEWYKRNSKKPKSR
jgi:hypothetical protein